MTFPTLVDVEFTIPLVAPDPRKYSTTLLVPTATIPAPVINPLTLPVTLPHRVPRQHAADRLGGDLRQQRDVRDTAGDHGVGPISNPSIVNAATGQVITFTGLTLAATDQLIISTDARQAFLNGSFEPADVNSGLVRASSRGRRRST